MGSGSKRKSGGVGKLVFKGDKKNKSKISRTSTILGDHQEQAVVNEKIVRSQHDEGKMILKMIEVEGKGLISSSGTTIMGHNGSKFSKEFRNGVAIVIYHPVSNMEEMRVVRMVLSDISFSISSKFSSDLKQPLSFRYIHAPRKINEEKQKEQELKLREKAEDERVAFGTYATSNELVYREKSSTGTSYVIRREALNRDVSRGDLLTMRSKKKSDRYC